MPAQNRSPDQVPSLNGLCKHGIRTPPHIPMKVRGAPPRSNRKYPPYLFQRFNQPIHSLIPLPSGGVLPPTGDHLTPHWGVSLSRESPNSLPESSHSSANTAVKLSDSWNSTLASRAHGSHRGTARWLL